MRRPVVLVVVVALVLVVAAGALTVVLRGRKGPPPAPTAADTFRVHSAGLANGGQRPATSISYGGHRFTVSLGLVKDGDPPSAQLVLTGPGRDLPLATYRQGQRIDFDGCALQVVSVYQAKSDADDLVDLRVIAG